MLLLFEIGRRLVKDSSESSVTKKAFDSLLIEKAINGILTLLDQKKCEFRDVFSKEGKFHCFSDPEPKEREKAIEKIFKALPAGDEEGETESRTDDSVTEDFKEKLTLTD